MSDRQHRDDICTSTRAIHGGEEKGYWKNALTVPIAQTSTYVFENTQAVTDFVNGENKQIDYGRYGNPTQHVTEKKLAEIEGAEAAILFSSGMNAITTTLLAMLSNGQHAVIMDDCYRKTTQFCNMVLRKFGIESTFIHAGDFEALEDAIQDNTRVLVSESPTNPHLNVIDLERVVEVAKKHRVKTIIDSTFATPFNQRPLEFGIDLVVHSATKYFGGHNDLMAGVIAGSDPLVSAIKDYRGVLGGVVDPHCVYLLNRGLKTFPLRMQRHNESTLALARFLDAHPKVKQVYYPGLECHPHYDVAKAQMRGFGGVVSFDLDADQAGTLAFLDRLQIPCIGASLGGVESIVSHPASISYYELAREDRLAIGITDELVRVAVGIEDTDDIIADFEQALV
ncbi:MAG: aminotransferase class I/II-fold pyridoxal phosphate-dependent enzyme [Candidatus Latescibacteria bacterium]|nr:aminotransferase class I/II-fold pyridoxal phosphate-dependent enzyme [Candidatus Latescibacterota bacterium]MBT5829825.1 aminotransferase class I/II-fold pyridoxal phosphate-dependent enzyme [Candidatus Latescibacterota bacterium]